MCVSLLETGDDASVLVFIHQSMLAMYTGSFPPTAYVLRCIRPYELQLYSHAHA